MTSTGDFNGISNDSGMGPIGISMQDMGARAAMLGSTSISQDFGVEFGNDSIATAELT